MPISVEIITKASYAREASRLPVNKSTYLDISGSWAMSIIGIPAQSRVTAAECADAFTEV